MNSSRILPTRMTPAEPAFVETPLASIPDRQVELVIVDQFKFQVERPTDSYALLDDPIVREAHDRDEYMPYWADIWPAARMLAKAVAREDWDEYPRTGDKLDALELGCGLGIPGLAALARGLRVTFTDYDLTAVRFAASNARRNKLYDFRAIPLDWRFPPADLKVPVILGADLTYEARNIDPLVKLIRQVLLPGGVCLLTDQDRTPAPLLREQLGYAGLHYDQELVRAGEPGGYRIRGTLYRIRHRV
jgi:ETFB lysine methyltransferase